MTNTAAPPKAKRKGNWKPSPGRPPGRKNNKTLALDVIAGGRNNLQAAPGQLVPALTGVGIAFGSALGLEQDDFAAAGLGPGGQQHSVAQGLSRIGGFVADALKKI